MAFFYFIVAIKVFVLWHGASRFFIQAAVAKEIVSLDYHTNPVDGDNQVTQRKKQDTRLKAKG